MMNPTTFVKIARPEDTMKAIPQITRDQLRSIEYEDTTTMNIRNAEPESSLDCRVDVLNEARRARRPRRGLTRLDHNHRVNHHVISDTIQSPTPSRNDMDLEVVDVDSCPPPDDPKTEPQSSNAAPSVQVSPPDVFAQLRLRNSNGPPIVTPPAFNIKVGGGTQSQKQACERPVAASEGLDRARHRPSRGLSRPRMHKENNNGVEDHKRISPVHKPSSNYMKSSSLTCQDLLAGDWEQLKNLPCNKWPAYLKPKLTKEAQYSLEHTTMTPSLRLAWLKDLLCDTVSLKVKWNANLRRAKALAVRAANAPPAANANADVGKRRAVDAAGSSPPPREFDVWPDWGIGRSTAAKANGPRPPQRRPFTSSCLPAGSLEEGMARLALDHPAQAHQIQQQQQKLQQQREKGYAEVDVPGAGGGGKHNSGGGGRVRKRDGLKQKRRGGLGGGGGGGESQKGSGGGGWGGAWEGETSGGRASETGAKGGNPAGGRAGAAAGGRRRAQF